MKNKLFTDAFINDDKDYTRKVTVDIDGETYEIAEIRFLTQFEVSDIYQSLSGSNIFEENDESPKINMNLFIHTLAVKSLVSWVFDKDITIDNIMYLKDLWKEPILKAVNDLREYWEAKDKPVEAPKGKPKKVTKA